MAKEVDPKTAGPDNSDVSNIDYTNREDAQPGAKKSTKASEASDKPATDTSTTAPAEVASPKNPTPSSTKTK